MPLALQITLKMVRKLEIVSQAEISSCSLSFVNENITKFVCTALSLVLLPGPFDLSG